MSIKSGGRVANRNSKEIFTNEKKYKSPYFKELNSKNTSGVCYSTIFTIKNGLILFYGNKETKKKKWILYMIEQWSGIILLDVFNNHDNMGLMQFWRGYGQTNVSSICLNATNIFYKKKN